MTRKAGHTVRTCQDYAAIVPAVARLFPIDEAKSTQIWRESHSWRPLHDSFADLPQYVAVVNARKLRSRYWNPFIEDLVQIPTAFVVCRTMMMSATYGLPRE